MLESKFRGRISRQLRQFGAVVIPYVGSTRGMSGSPDVYVSHKKFQGFIEFKGTRTPVRELQMVVLRKLHETGSRVYILREPGKLYDYKNEFICDVHSAVELLNKLQELGYET